MGALGRTQVTCMASVNFSRPGKDCCYSELLRCQQCTEIQTAQSGQVVCSIVVEWKRSLTLGMPSRSS